MSMETAAPKPFSTASLLARTRAVRLADATASFLIGALPSPVTSIAISLSTSSEDARKGKLTNKNRKQNIIFGYYITTFCPCQHINIVFWNSGKSLMMQISPLCGKFIPSCFQTPNFLLLKAYLVLVPGWVLCWCHSFLFFDSALELRHEPFGIPGKGYSFQGR